MCFLVVLVEIPSRPAASSHKLAEYLTSWLPEHNEIAAMFEAKMVSLLTSCIKGTALHSESAKKEDIVGLPQFCVFLEVFVRMEHLL